MSITCGLHKQLVLCPKSIWNMTQQPNPNQRLPFTLGVHCTLINIQLSSPDFINCVSRRRMNYLVNISQETAFSPSINTLVQFLPQFCLYKVEIQTCICKHTLDPQLPSSQEKFSLPTYCLC